MPSMHERFDGKPPLWLVDFADDPDQAVRDAIEGSYPYWGPLNPVDTETLWADWLECGLEEFTPALLDYTVERWARSQDLDVPLPSELPMRRAEWLRVIRIATWAPLPRTMSYLISVREQLEKLGGRILLLELGRLSWP